MLQQHRLVVLDGAHTRESAAALRSTLGAVFPGRPLAFVVAMVGAIFERLHRFERQVVNSGLVFILISLIISINICSTQSYVQASDKEHRAVIDELRACEPKVVIFTSVDIAGSSSRSCSPGA